MKQALLAMAVAFTAVASRTQAQVTADGYTGIVTDLGGGAVTNTTNANAEASPGISSAQVTALYPESINDTGTVAGFYLGTASTSARSGFSFIMGFAGPATGAPGALLSTGDLSGYPTPSNPSYNGDKTWAFGVNSSGTLAGSVISFQDHTQPPTAGITGTPAAISEIPTLSQLGTLQGGVAQTAGFGIDTAGDIVGQSQYAPTQGSGAGRSALAFLYTAANQTTHQLGVGQYWSSAYGINPAGTEAVGYQITKLATGSLGSTSRAQVNKQATIWTSSDGTWNAGTITAQYLGTLAGSATVQSTQSMAYSVNDAGVVVGGSDTASGPSEAFVYINGAMHSLNPNPLSSASGSTIGNPVYEDLSLATETTTGIGYQSNPVNSPIGTLDSLAESINNEDQAVGYQLDATGAKYAALWTIQPDGSSTLINLNDFAPAGLDLLEATGINNNGQIVGIGTSASGSGGVEGFVLTLTTAAVPEPTVPAAVAGVAVIALLGRRTRKTFACRV